MEFVVFFPHCIFIHRLDTFNAGAQIESELGHGETSWCFSQIKGALDDDVTDADIISCVEFNHDGELLATGDKGGRVVIFQVSIHNPFESIRFKLIGEINPIEIHYREILPPKRPYRSVVNTMSIQHFSHMSPNSIT